MKAEADVIFRVGSTSTQATLTALANKLLDTLRQAMRKARG
jgi:hypothetical protein